MQTLKILQLIPNFNNKLVNKINSKVQITTINITIEATNPNFSHINKLAKN